MDRSKQIEWLGANICGAMLDAMYPQVVMALR